MGPFWCILASEFHWNATQGTQLQNGWKNGGKSWGSLPVCKATQGEAACLCNSLARFWSFGKVPHFEKSAKGGYPGFLIPRFQVWQGCQSLKPYSNREVRVEKAGRFSKHFSQQIVRRNKQVEVRVFLGYHCYTLLFCIPVLWNTLSWWMMNLEDTTITAIFSLYIHRIWIASN